MIPLVIGVTGHRDLRREDREELERQVHAIFKGLAKKYGATPLVLLSSLAEGADRLAARVALKAGIQLVVPLPMPPEEYGKDFEAPASAEPGSPAEFKELLNQAERWFVVGDDEAAGPVEESDRERRYARAGAYIAHRCQLLIALWDGVDSGKEGGTADVVRTMLGGAPGEPESLDLPETGPVYCIVTPRRDNPDPPRKLTRFDLFPPNPTGGPIAIDLASDRPTGLHPDQEASARASFGRIYELVDQFNQDALHPRPEAVEAARRARGYIVPEQERPALPPGLGAKVEEFAVSDGLAQDFQRRMYRTQDLLLILAFVVTAWFQAHIYLRAAYPLSMTRRPLYMGIVVLIDRVRNVYLAWMDVPYLALVVVLLWLYRRARRLKFHTKYLDYRALAEGLRVQIYWRLAGLTDSVADHYMSKQKGELDWIRAAIRAGETVRGVQVAGGASGNEGHRLGLVLRHWVEDQLGYFLGIPRHPGRPVRRKGLRRLLTQIRGSDLAEEFRGRAQARRDERRRGRFRVLGSVLIYVAFAFVVYRGFAPPDHPRVIALVLATTALVLLGLYARVRAFSEQAKQYSRIGNLFAIAHRRLADLLDRGDTKRARGLIRALGREALAENGDWVLLHRERPLELPRP